MGNKTSRRIAGVFLSLVMLLSLLPTAAFAAEGNFRGKIYYNYNVNTNNPANGSDLSYLLYAGKIKNTKDLIVIEEINDGGSGTLAEGDTLQLPNGSTYTANSDAEISVDSNGNVLVTAGSVNTKSLLTMQYTQGEEQYTISFKVNSGTGTYSANATTGKLWVADNTTVEETNGFLFYSSGETPFQLAFFNSGSSLSVTVAENASMGYEYATVKAYNGSAVVECSKSTSSTRVLTLTSGSARVCGTLKVGNHTFSTVPTSGSSYTYTNFIVDANGTSLKLAENGTVMMDGTVYLSGSSDNTFTIGSRGSNTAITVPDGATVSAGTNSVTGKTESGVDAQVEITDDGSRLTLFAGKGESTSQMKVEENGKSEGRTYTKQSGDGVYEAAVNDATLKVGAGVTVRDGNTKANFTNINSNDVFTFTAWNTVKVPKGTKVTKGSYEIQGAGGAVVTTDGEENTALTLTSGSGSSSSKMLAKVTNGTASFEAKNTSTTYTVDTNNHKLTLNANGEVKVTVDDTDFVFANNSDEPETFEFKNGIITVPKQTSITSYNNSNITSSVTGGGGAQVAIENGVVVLTSGKGISTGTMVTKLNGDKVTFVGNGKQFTVDATANAEKQLILSKDAVVSTTVNSKKIEIASTANDKQLGFKKDSSGNITMDVPKQTSVTSYDGNNAITSSVTGGGNAVVTIAEGNVVLTAGEGKSTGKMIASINNVTKTFEKSSETASFTVNAKTTDPELNVTAGTVVSDSITYTNGKFVFKSADKSIDVYSDAKITGSDNKSNVTGGLANVKVGNGQLILTAGTGTVEGPATVYAKVGDKNVRIDVAESATAAIDLKQDAKIVKNLTVGKSITVENVTYTVVADSEFPLDEHVLDTKGEEATIPGDENRQVDIKLVDSNDFNIVTIPSTNNSNITVTKTAEGGTVTVTLEGGYFTVNEKTYTAGSAGAVFTVAKNGNVYITSGTATLNPGDSVYGGKSGKEIKNSNAAGGDAVTVEVVEGKEIVTLPEANDKVSIGTHVYTANVDNTQIAVTDNNQLIKGAVILKDGESIYGKSGKYIENPTGGTADEIIVTAYANENTDSVKVDPYRQVIIGGATYTASNEGVTLAVKANGSVSVIAGSLQTYHRHKSAVDANKASSTTTTTTTDGKKSPTTFDAGVGIYAVSAILSVTGMAWVGKKKF